jgi:hypothetical protein
MQDQNVATLWRLVPTGSHTLQNVKAINADLRQDAKMGVGRQQAQTV